MSPYKPTQCSECPSPLKHPPTGRPKDTCSRACYLKRRNRRYGEQRAFDALHAGPRPPRKGSHNTLKTACPKGHEYAGSNVYTDARGWRRCRTCALAQTAACRLRRKEKATGEKQKDEAENAAHLAEAFGAGGDLEPGVFKRQTRVAS